MTYMIGSGADRVSVKLCLNPNAWNFSVKDQRVVSEAKSRSTWKLVLEFLGTANGAFRSVQMADKGCKLMARLGGTTGQVFSDLGKVLTPAWAGTILPYLPFALNEAKEAVKSAPTPTKDSFEMLRKVVDITSKTAVACAATAHASRFLLSAFKTAGVAKCLGPIGMVADGAELVSSACELQKTTSEYRALRSLRQKVKETEPDGVKAHVASSTRLCELKVAKVVTGVLSTLFGFSGLALLVAGAGLPATIPFGLISAVLSIASVAFTCKICVEESRMKYKPIDPWKHVSSVPVEENATEMESVDSESRVRNVTPSGENGEWEDTALFFPANTATA